jgi:arabinofuranan 3-O-arabinosyltransferase
VRITHWASTSRAVQVGPGVASWLVVSENANSGWAASLDGRSLAPGIVDGWKQAFVVPAGAGGLIRLTYRPDRLFRDGLLLGAVAALLLLGLAFAPERRQETSPAAAPADQRRARALRPTVAAGAAVAVLALVGGSYAVWGLLLAVAVAIGWRVARPPTPGRGPTALQLAGLLGIAGASVLAALDPASRHGPGGSIGSWAQILALGALATLALRMGRPTVQGSSAGE